MSAVLLSVHVVAAIVLVGPMTVAASLFPRYAREAVTPEEPADDATAPRPGPVAVARALHRISRVYAIAALSVPVFGIATAARMGILGQAWLIVSIALTAVAAALLVVGVIPGQRRLLDALDRGSATSVPAAALSRLGMVTGVFALTWVVVTILMIVRPGSTTGVGR